MGSTSAGQCALAAVRQASCTRRPLRYNQPAREKQTGGMAMPPAVLPGVRRPQSTRAFPGPPRHEMGF